jgi:hypothetical protein
VSATCNPQSILENCFVRGQAAPANQVHLLVNVRIYDRSQPVLRGLNIRGFRLKRPKYGEVYLRACDKVGEARNSIGRYLKLLQQPKTTFEP